MEDAMKINRKGRFVLAAAALVAVAAVVSLYGVTAKRSTIVRADDDVIGFRARLTGFGEVPPKLVEGSGTFVGTLSADGQSISWTLTWTGLSGPAQVAHIHFGPPQNTGTPVVFFCNGGKPAGPCPGGPGHSGMLPRPITPPGGGGGPLQKVTAGGVLRPLGESPPPPRAPARSTPPPLVGGG